MGLKNEEARARRRVKQKELLSCESIRSEDQIQKSYGPPKLSLENNFGWQVVEKAQVGDGFFPHFTGFYEKPDLSGKEFQKVTYVLYMNKGAVVKEDRVVEDTKSVVKVESVRTQPSATVVEKPIEIVESPVEDQPPDEVLRQRPKRHKKKLIEEFYYQDLKTRILSRPPSPAPVKKPKPLPLGAERPKSGKKNLQTSSKGITDSARGEPDKRESEKTSKGVVGFGDPDTRKSNKSSMGMMGFRHGGSERRKTEKSLDHGVLEKSKHDKSVDHGRSDKPKRHKSSHRMMGFTRVSDEYHHHGHSLHGSVKSLESLHSEPSRIQKAVSFDKGLSDANDTSDVRGDPGKQPAPVKDKKQLKEDKKRETIAKAKARMERRDTKMERWRAGASTVSMTSKDQPENRELSLTRKRDVSVLPLAEKPSELIESVMALPKKFRKPSESLLKTPSGSNHYLYVPVRRNASARRKVVH